MIKILKTSLLLSVLTLGNAFTAEHEVKMLTWGKGGSMVYEPAVLRVEVGDTVTFIPTQSGHQVKSHTIPEGAAEFISSLDEKFSVTLDKEGIYLYYCPPHRMMNMSGLIQVGKPVNRDKIDVGIDEVEKMATSSNKGRLLKYIKLLDSSNQSNQDNQTKQDNQEP